MNIENSCKWFSTLVKGDQPQRRAIENLKFENNKILIARQVSPFNYFYGSYKNTEDILKFIYQDSDEAEKSNYHLFEVIREGQLRKHYFDIEFLIQPKIEPSKVLKILVREFNYFMQKYLDINNFIGDCNLAVSESSGIRKKTTNLNEASFHMVVNSNYVFRNEIEQKKVMDYFTDLMLSSEDDEIKKYLICNGSPIWDNRVYTKNRQMRMINNSKFGQTRILRPIKINDFKYHFIGIYDNYLENNNVGIIDVSKIPDNHEVKYRISKNKIMNIKIKTGTLSQKLKINPEQLVPNDFNGDNLRDILWLIPNCGDYYQPYYIWLLIGQSLYSYKSEKNKEKDLLKLWEEWTTQDSNQKYNSGDCQKHFKKFISSEDSKKTLLNFAKKCCPDIVVRNVKNNAVKTLFDDKTTIDTIYQETTDNNYYVCDIKPYQESGYDVFVIKAMMGTGKSYQVRNFIKKMDFKRILILSTRCSYANNVYGELNNMFNNEFLLYSDKETNLASDIDKLVIQIHSIHKLPENFNEYDCVVVDECESILMDLTSGIIKEREKNYKNFERLLNSKYVIFLDAFMTRRTLSLVEYIKDKYQKNPIYIKNEHMPYNFKAHQLDGIKGLTYKLEHSLRNNKKVYFFITKKNGSPKCPDGANNIYKSIVEQFPNKNIKLYTGDTNNKKELQNVNENWKDIDCIITTSTITVGVNFDIKHFDELFCYATSNTCTQRDIMQGLFRARHINDAVLYYSHPDETYKFVNENHLHYQTVCENFDNGLYQAELIEKEIELDNKIRLLWKEEYKWLKDIHKHNKFEDYNKKENFALVFQRYLKQSGFYRQNDELEFEINDMFKLITTYRTPYSCIKTIDRTEYEFLEKKLSNFESLTQEEKDSMMKYRFDTLVKPINLTGHKVADGLQYIMYDDLFTTIYKNPVNRDRLYNLYYEKQESIEKIMEKEYEKAIFRCLSLNRHIKFKKLNEIKKILGIETTQETIEIDRNILEEKSDEINKLYESCSSVFDSRIRTKDIGIKRAVLQINAMLSDWGFTKINTIQKFSKKDENRKNIYDGSKYILTIDKKYVSKTGKTTIPNPQMIYELLRDKIINEKFNECMVE